MRRNDDPRFHYAFSPLDDRRWRDVFVHNKKLDNKMCYAFDALMSRGAHFCDQLLVEKGDRDAFMDAVETAYKEQRHLALAALERLLRAVDETEQMEEPLVVMLASAVDEARRTMFAAQGDNSKHALESGGYIRLRTAVITPTRIRFYTPEWQMSNRVLRTDDIRWPSNRFLRVVYRDEDDSKLDASSGQTFVRYFLENTLRKGIRCAGWRAAATRGGIALAIFAIRCRQTISLSRRVERATARSRLLFHERDHGRGQGAGRLSRRFFQGRKTARNRQTLRPMFHADVCSGRCKRRAPRIRSHSRNARRTSIRASMRLQWRPRRSSTRTRTLSRRFASKRTA